MNIVNAGSRYQIFGEDVQTYRLLPSKCYDVCFHPMQGFWLQERDPITTNNEKIYGGQDRKVKKVFEAYTASNRNLGIILSGPKGIGKSLFAKLLIETAQNNLMPAIIVSQYFPGIADFLGSIKQRAVVLFDEFEKTFAKVKDTDPQVEMLPLFDGVDAGEKLFVITCNNYNKLNEFLLNRPGRFHYHFTMTAPNPEEVSAYLYDKLSEEYRNLIPDVVNFSLQTDLTYDTLRAIAFELNRGYSIKETFGDLNMMKIECVFYMTTVEFIDGSIATSLHKDEIDFFGDSPVKINLAYADDTETYLTFNPVNAKMDPLTGKFILPGAKAKVKTYFEYFDHAPSEEDQNRINNLTIKNVEFVRVRSKTDRYIPAI